MDRLEGSQFAAEDQDEDPRLVNIEPLIDPFTGVRLFHIASHNLYDSSILTRNVEANQTWFMKVQRAIYKSYASLASALQRNLKDRIYVSKNQRKGAASQFDADTMFEDLQ